MSPARLGSNRHARFDGDCADAGDDDEVHAPPPPQRNEEERRVLAEAGDRGRRDSRWTRWTRGRDATVFVWGLGGGDR